MRMAGFLSEHVRLGAAPDYGAYRTRLRFKVTMTAIID
jgi:hypothetical protein